MKQDKFTRILQIILGIILLIGGGGVILSSIPITNYIGDLCQADKIIHGFLWSIMLLCAWAVGLCMFFIGIVVINPDSDAWE